MSGNNVVELKKPKPCEDIVATLRLIADEIESGAGPKWPITTAAIIFGHTEERPDGDLVAHGTYWRTHAFGPRVDALTVRGLLATIISKGFESGDAA